jgi:hypothetical protein
MLQHTRRKKRYRVPRPCFYGIAGGNPIGTLGKATAVIPPNEAGTARLETIHGKLGLAGIDRQRSNFWTTHNA